MDGWPINQKHQRENRQHCEKENRSVERIEKS